MNEQGLLPCPFCGSPARKNSETGNNILEWVECSQCWLHTKPTPSGDDAIAAWNTRTSLPPPAEPEQAAKCEWCAEGNPRIRSSVSDAWVHTDTAIGRKVCRDEETPAQSALRSLASYVGNGGYNAPFVDADVFEAKVRDGIDRLVRVEGERAAQRTAELEKRVEELETRERVLRSKIEQSFLTTLPRKAFVAGTDVYQGYNNGLSTVLYILDNELSQAKEGQDE